MEIGINAKECGVCKEIKYFTEFNVAKSNAFGYSYQCKPCRKVYLESRRDRDRQLANESRAKNRDRVNTVHKAWCTNNRENYMYKQAKSRAKRKGIDFTIEISDIIIPENCPILGIKLIMGTKDDYQSSPSLDRVDTTKGYIKGNVQVISSLANTMKNCATKEQLLLFCKNIPDYINEDIVRTI